MSQPTTTAAWRALTWDDLELWAGGTSMSRGREYHRGGLVQHLGITPEGRLLAWVQGSHLYATAVELQPADDGMETPLLARCSCPVNYRCKHAVAVILTYLDALKKGNAVPMVEASDPRWVMLPPEDEEQLELLPDFGEATVDLNVSEESPDDAGDEDLETDEDNAPAPVPAQRKPAKVQSLSPKKLLAFLAGLSKERLIKLILELARHSADASDHLRKLTTPAGEDNDALIQDTRREILRRTAEESSLNSWTGQGSLPDYSGIEKQFKKLLAAKQYDALLDLGKELYQRGRQQVEQAHDEGETASAIAACMKWVFKALPQTSLKPAEQLLCAVDLAIGDEFALCKGAEKVLDAAWPKPVWSAVVDVLLARLRRMSKPKKDGPNSFKREQLTDWIVDALEDAGRKKEIIPLYESEARLNRSYASLVRYLMEEGKHEAAHQWAQEGIDATCRTAPAMAHSLRLLLRELAKKRGDWPALAASLAEEFFTSPSTALFDELTKAARKAGHGPEVEAALCRFLETGKTPAAKDWPLPCPTPPTKGRRGKTPPDRRLVESPPCGPRHDLLLELAFRAKQPNDILHWYDKLYAGRRILPDSLGYGQAGDNGVRVADSVAATHPERSIAIYKERTAALVETGRPDAYPTAGQLLRKLRKLLSRLKRNREWEAFVLELETKHQRKKQFLEVIERLRNPKIIDGD